jgi:hypothetical protein
MYVVHTYSGIAGTAVTNNVGNKFNIRQQFLLEGDESSRYVL